MRQGIPERIGRHEIVALLGEGGMARVYLAVSRGPAGVNKLAVIKLIRTELAGDRDFVTMFLDEARLASRLNHPNVVQTYDVLKDGENYILVMEYLEGQPLSDIFTRLPRKSFPLEEHLWVLTQVLAGLQYAHALADYDGSPLGVVHRDVSPANVFITYHGDVKLLDFGIAKASDAVATTKNGTIKGKIGYCAPEQIQGQGKPDARADIFAVGVMLWEALAGRRLRTGTQVATAQARISGGESKIREICPDVDPALADICDRAMALAPADRYATAAEFQHAIESYLAKTARRVGRAQLASIVQGHFEVERRLMRKRVEEQLAGTQDASTAKAIADESAIAATSSADATPPAVIIASVLASTAPAIQGARASTPISVPARAATPGPNPSRSLSPLGIPTRMAAAGSGRTHSESRGVIPARQVPTGEVTTRRVNAPIVSEPSHVVPIPSPRPMPAVAADGRSANATSRPRRQWVVVAIVIGVFAGAAAGWATWTGWKGNRQVDEETTAPSSITPAVAAAPPELAANALLGRAQPIAPIPQPRPDPPSAPGSTVPATIKIRVRVEPKQVALTLDDHAIGGNQLQAVVPKDGTMHVVQATAPGFVPLNRIVSFTSDINLDIQLRRALDIQPRRARSAVHVPTKSHSAAVEAKPGSESKPRPEPSRVEEPGANLERPASRRASKQIDERDPYAP